MSIDNYLNQHTIIRIGITLPGYVCCEIIVDNPKELISVVRENGCYISEILWWERAELISGSHIGHGGPRDPRSPDSHYFAETDIQKVFDTIWDDEEYYKYFDQIKQAHPGCDLYPGFDIKPLAQT